MIAYKVFNPDWTCRGFKYQIGETYEEDVNPSICDRGFHFCKQLADCFNYYKFDSDNKVAEIEALGDIAEGDDKCCTNKIKIMREITWYEVLETVNIGKGNTGLGNTGNCNTGNQNPGDCNTGNCNTGNQNPGGWNTGDCNTGNCNTGNQNTGYWNTGNCNTGDCNTGNCNTGNWNVGDFNLSDNNAGCFNVDDHKLILFDRETDMTWHQWQNSRARALLLNIAGQKTKWVNAEDMTDQEKLERPSYETTGGYLKKRDISNAYQEWWDRLSGYQKQIIRAIPNFDAKKFEMITGINTEKEGNE